MSEREGTGERNQMAKSRVKIHKERKAGSWVEWNDSKELEREGERILRKRCTGTAGGTGGGVRGEGRGGELNHTDKRREESCHIATRWFAWSWRLLISTYRTRWLYDSLLIQVGY